jgi:hypothetical protein
LRDLRTEADEALVTYALAVLSLHHGMLRLAQITMCTEDEREEMLKAYWDL